MPLGRGYFDARVALSPEAAAATVEGGWHPVTGWALYGVGKALIPWEGDPTAYLGLGVRRSW